MHKGTEPEAALAKDTTLPGPDSTMNPEIQQKPEDVHQDPLHQVEERTESTGILRPKFGSCVKSSSDTRM